MWNALFPLTAAILLSACAQQVETCTQAVASGQTESSALAGGILEAEGDPRLGEPPQSKIFCTAAMGNVDGVPVLYGARHCFRIGSYRNFVFHRFSGGEYRPQPISFPKEANAEKIKSDKAITNPALKAELRGILDGGPAMTLSGDAAIKRCVEKLPGGTSACFTGLEFAAVRLREPSPGFRPSKEISARQVTALEALDTFWTARAVTAFRSDLTRCESGAVQCDPLFRTEGKAAWAQHFASKDWTRTKTTAHSAAFNGIGSVWSDLDEQRVGFAVAGNFSGTNSFGTTALAVREVAPDTPPTAEQTLTRWQDNRPYSRTFLLRSLEGAPSSLKLSSGDSGSLLLAGGLPVAVLSHVDGKETSGGASVIALPERKKVAAGPGKPGLPSTASANGEGRVASSSGESGKSCEN